MYEFKIEPNENIVLITLNGLLSKNEWDAFLALLLEKLKSLNTSQYHVIIDTQNLKASAVDSIDNIKTAVQLFVTTPFKGRYNIVSKSVITNVQIKQIVKNHILNKITPVGSYEEILNLLDVTL